MHGKVCEWCADWYAGKAPGGSVTAPTGPASGSHRVNHGGIGSTPRATAAPPFAMGMSRTPAGITSASASLSVQSARRMALPLIQLRFQNWRQDEEACKLKLSLRSLRCHSGQNGSTGPNTATHRKLGVAPLGLLNENHSVLWTGL